MIMYSLPIAFPAFCLPIVEDPHKRSKIVAVEGMPGAGKTTILASLAEQLEGDCVLLSELNLEPYSLDNNLSFNAKRALFHKLWIERLSFLMAFRKSDACFLLDRSHFSNLAFTYAFDTAYKTGFYPSYKKLFNKEFESYPIDKIFVLDVSPEEGLKRRLARREKIPAPWSNITFLEAIREFFHKELPKNYSGRIIYIDAHQKKDIVRSIVLNEVLKVTGKDSTPHASPLVLSKEDINKLLTFAKSQNLGNTCTRVLNALGQPTLYFLKHSIQLDEGRPVFFNNGQLFRLLQTHDL